MLHAPRSEGIFVHGVKPCCRLRRNPCRRTPVWIVQLGFGATHTFISHGPVITSGGFAAVRPPTDIFPLVDIPVGNACSGTINGVRQRIGATHRCTLPSGRDASHVKRYRAYRVQSLAGSEQSLTIYFQPGAEVPTGHSADLAISAASYVPACPNTLRSSSGNSASAVPIMQLGSAPDVSGAAGERTLGTPTSSARRCRRVRGASADFRGRQAEGRV